MLCERVSWAFSAHKRLVSMTIACEVQAAPHMRSEDHAGHFFSGRALATVHAAYLHCAWRCLAGKGCQSGPLHRTVLGAADSCAPCLVSENVMCSS